MLTTAQPLSSTGEQQTRAHRSVVTQTPSASLRLGAYPRRSRTSSCAGLEQSFYGNVTPLKAEAPRVTVNRPNGLQVSANNLIPTEGLDMDLPALADLDYSPIINERGRVMPPVKERAAASIFAIFDSEEQIQYIGFSKAIRNTLRTVLGRRPEQCFYYKKYDFVQLDQTKMSRLREEWIKECGGVTPPGNRSPESKIWQASAPLGTRRAAEKMAAEVNTALKARGLTEAFDPDVDQLEKGIWEVMASLSLTDEALDAEELLKEHMLTNTKLVQVAVDDVDVEFTIFFRNEFKTNGGWMYDVNVLMEEKETSHRVIVGSDWTESTGLDGRSVVQSVFGFLLNRKVPRHTEGLLLSNQFPINYFSISEVEQWYPDFAHMFKDTPGDAYWRFNRIETYGGDAAADTLSEGHPLLGPSPTAGTSGTWSV